MFSPQFIIILVGLYLLLLFAIALYAEKMERQGRSLVNNAYIYSLSLAVYCTSWTFYGSVGRAANQGLTFLPIYLGPTVMIVLWPIFLTKIVRLARENRLTTIPDFIAARYGNSMFLSVLAAVVMVVGIIPYISLQIKAITATFVIVAGKTDWGMAASFATALMLGVFTILFGARRLDSSERHGGLVFAIAFESMVKLFAFLLVGIFVTFYLFDGLDDIFSRVNEHDFADLLFLGPGTRNGYLEWFSLMLVSMFAIIFLPRQFQMAVVENNDVAHVRKASWILPIYLFLICAFVLPIAFGGLLMEGAPRDADYFVLTMPFNHGSRYLAAVVFIGGFSAATGMVIVEVLALSTIVMNSIVTPCLSRFHELPGFAAMVLNVKRLVIMLILFVACIFTVSLGGFESLVEIGLKSFEAVALFAPPLLLGIYWKGANKRGAAAGLSAGFVIWFYVTLVPILLKAGLLDPKGVIGLMTASEFFNPNALFGVMGLGKTTHTLFWTLLFDLGLLVGLSLLTRQDEEEKAQARLFVDLQGMGKKFRAAAPFNAIHIENILDRYLDRDSVQKAMRDFLLSVGKEQRGDLTEGELVDLKQYAERIVAGYVGASLAAVIFSKGLNAQAIAMNVEE